MMALKKVICKPGILLLTLLGMVGGLELGGLHADFHPSLVYGRVLAGDIATAEGGTLSRPTNQQSGASAIFGAIDARQTTRQDGSEGLRTTGQFADLTTPQFTLSLNTGSFSPGDTLTLMAMVDPGTDLGPVDVYIALQFPDQALFFFQADGSFTPEFRPVVAGWTVTPFDGEIFRHAFNGGEASGRYTWLAVFTRPGTLEMVSNIAQAPFTFEAPIFMDDFDDGSVDDWTVLRGLWAVKNGEFVESSDVSAHNIAVNGPNVVDFLLTAQLRSTDDDDLGLVFRLQDGNNFYLVLLRYEPGKIELRKSVGGAFHTLASISTNSFIKGVPIEVGVRAEQTHLQVFLNGRTVIDVDAGEVTGGSIGLYARANKYAAFDSVRVTALDSLKAVGGQVIYVDAANAGGPDDGLTVATAWGTIAEALQDPRFEGSAGNTIVIQAGVYHEQVDVFAHASGIPGAFNTIRAAAGAEVVVDGEKDTANARVEAVLIHTGVSYIRIEGLTLRNAQHRCLLAFESGPGEIVGNHIHNCGDSGLEFWYGARNYDVAYNLIHSNEGDGIVLSQGSGSDPSQDKANQGILMRNNLLLNHGQKGGDAIIVAGDKPHTFAIYNNTIVGNLGNGIFLQQGVGAGDVRNNIVVANGAIGLKNFADLRTDYNNLFANGAAYADGPAHVDPGPHTMSVDPLFMNATAWDFRLQPGSPCIDAGDPAVRFNDPDGTRNDLGVFGGPL